MAFKGATGRSMAAALGRPVDRVQPRRAKGQVGRHAGTIQTTPFPQSGRKRRTQ